MICITLKHIYLVLCFVDYIGYASLIAMQPPQQSTIRPDNLRRSSSLSIADCQLLAAATDGNLTAVDKALAAGARHEATDNSQRTALFLAVGFNHEHVVRRLLTAHANVNINPFGTTPLHVAVLRGHYQIVQELIQAGASVNMTNGKGWTALHTAAAFGRSRIVQLLINAEAAVNASAHDNTTPLHLAVETGNEAAIRLLIAAGANVNAYDNSLLRPLHLAAKRDHTGALNLLLAHPDILINVIREQNDNYLQTPLQLALDNHHLIGAQLLIRHGVTATAGQIATALGSEDTVAYRAATGQLDEVDLLGIDPLSDELGEALLYAIGQRHVGTVRLLMEALKMPNRSAESLISCILQRRTLTPEARATYQEILQLMQMNLHILEEELPTIDEQHLLLRFKLRGRLNRAFSNSGHS